MFLLSVTNCLGICITVVILLQSKLSLDIHFVWENSDFDFIASCNCFSYFFLSFKILYKSKKSSSSISAHAIISWHTAGLSANSKAVDSQTQRAVSYKRSKYGADFKGVTSVECPSKVVDKYNRQFCNFLPASLHLSVFDGIVCIRYTVVCCVNKRHVWFLTDR